jgi:hypothetical protein
MALPTQHTVATTWSVAYATPAVQADADSTASQLRAQFVRAHGQPTGEVTTLRPSGVFLSGPERPR